ncbi:hypothetical protein HGRIS_003814 [Hohenbuehelia grisea]|uniref:Uncharacterized protein n=1 Tax=Hohenbuehelia grisea TaxID=104357 RepID=A0ABR3JI75_9AGAR
MVRLIPKNVRRQVDPFALPTAAGISGNVVLSSASVTATSLQFDASAAPNAGGQPAFSITSVPPTAPGNPPASATDSAPAAASSSSSHSIPISTVVGACVGAFAGAIFLICIGLWFYQRSTSALRARSRAPLTSIARTRGEQRGRPPSQRGDPWNKIESGDEDKWAMQERERKHSNDDKRSLESVTPMEKLTMFKKRTPSTRTAVTSKSNEDLPLPVLDRMRPPHPYNPYGGGGGSAALAPIDTGAAESWGAEVDASYLAMRSSPFDNSTARALSPVANPARQTPTATEHPTLHRWESAEVINYEDNHNGPQKNTNPFADASYERRSQHNPFFSAKDSERATGSAFGKSAKGLSAGKASTMNPFDSGDESALSYLSATDTLVPPTGLGGGMHTPSGSMSDSERAIQSIIAVLDNPGYGLAPSPEPARVVSGVSTMGESVVTEEDVTSAFPLPPQVPKP